MRRAVQKKKEGLEGGRGGGRWRKSAFKTSEETKMKRENKEKRAKRE